MDFDEETTAAPCKPPFPLGLLVGLAFGVLTSFVIIGGVMLGMGLGSLLD